MTMTLCGLTALALNAQVATVEQAKKLAGKTDKIEEARALIQEAIANPETANQANTYYVAGKIEWDAYDKQKAGGGDPIQMAQELLNGFNYNLQVFPLDELPNEKGEVKPKFTKNLQKAIKEKTNDFFDAGANLFNGKDYANAYDAFMIYGNMPDLQVLGKEAPQIADTIRAVAFYNAGLAAWTLNDLDKAAVAFAKAAENNYNAPEAYLYEIACWQNIEQDSTRAKEAQSAIWKAAKAGNEKFGMAQPVFLNNMVNTMVNSNNEAEALNIVNDALAKYPENPSLYGLRAFVNDRLDKSEEAEKDYRIAAEMPNVDYETLRNAVRNIFHNGQKKWNEIDFNDPNAEAKKNELKETYFKAAKKYAEKANQLHPNDSDIEYLLENIDYQLTL